jgi:hypothetical protein
MESACARVHGILWYVLTKLGFLIDFKAKITNYVYSSRFGPIEMSDLHIDGLLSHMQIQVHPVTSSTIRIQRLYYPPISDTRPHAYLACEYWRTQDEVTKRALLTPLLFFIFLFLFFLADA